MLLVAPQDDNRRRIAAAFASTEAVIDTVCGPDEAVELGRRSAYDLILLAYDEVANDLRRLRLSGIATPVIWLSIASAMEDRVLALGLGADDCLELGMCATELIARSRSVVRRARGHAAATIRIGDLEIDMAAQTVVFAGRRLRITGKEFALLELLALRRGAVVSRETIMDHLYGGPEEPVAKIIDIHVCRIRRKLAEVAPGEMPLRTVWGRGFLLSAPAFAAGASPMAA